MIVVGRDCLMNVREKVSIKKGEPLSLKVNQKWHFPGYNDAIIEQYGNYDVFDFKRKEK